MSSISKHADFTLAKIGTSLQDHSERYPLQYIQMGMGLPINKDTEDPQLFYAYISLNNRIAYLASSIN